MERCSNKSLTRYLGHAISTTLSEKYLFSKLCAKMLKFEHTTHSIIFMVYLILARECKAIKNKVCLMDELLTCKDPCIKIQSD